MSDYEQFQQILAREFSPFSTLTAAQVEHLYNHYSKLALWNRMLNLSSVSNLEEAVTRHYCESLFVALHLPPEPVSVLDIGSGAGFPGIPIAVFRPDCAVTLAESHQRKAVFLKEATRELGNIRVLARRAEDLQERFDWIVSRAVRFADVLRIGEGIGAGLEPPLRVALLLGRDDAEKAAARNEVSWEPARLLPWGKRRVLLLGEYVSRGTDR